MHRCNLPNCAGCKPCCTDVDQKQPDPPTVIPDDQPIKRDDYQPVQPAWDDNSNRGRGKSCWDPKNKQSIIDGNMISCSKGGTRMCTNGEWRVTQGECSADEALASNDSGNDDSGNAQPTVTPVYVESSGQKTYVAAASASQGGNKKGGGKRRLLAPRGTPAANMTMAKTPDASQGKHRDPCGDALPSSMPCPLSSGLTTRDGKRRLLGSQATAATTLAQSQSQDPDLPCDANAGCPMDQSYWLCWPGSYR